MAETPWLEHEDDEGEFFDDEERDCFRCGGDGWTECNNSLECTNEHTPDGLCRCKSCGGSGLAKDMTVW